MSFDAIVVGARCSGASTAMLLSRAGHRILLLDRATFPSDTMSTHWLQLPAVAHLRAWGLLSAVLSAGTPPIARGILDAGPGLRFPTQLPVLDGTPAVIAPRRTVLDDIIVRAAADAGADVREGFNVTELVHENGAVVGIRGKGSDGRVVEERAKVVIGADGRNSRIARFVGARKYSESPAQSCFYYSYWRDVPADGEFYIRPDRVVIAFPTNDDLTLIVLSHPIDRFSRVRRDVEGEYLRALEEDVPDLAARARGGSRAARFTGTADVPSFFRTASGDGWALVGDAGYHKDPAPAEGITDAFHDAAQLAAVLDRAFLGETTVSDALATFAADRDEKARPYFDLCRTIADIDRPPQERLAAFAQKAKLRERDFGLMTVAPEEPHPSPV